MTGLDRRAALLARLDGLERDATSVAGAFTGRSLQADAIQILELLGTARMSLGVAHSGEQLESVEGVIEAAGLLLTSLGRIEPSL